MPDRPTRGLIAAVDLSAPQSPVHTTEMMRPFAEPCLEIRPAQNDDERFFRRAEGSLAGPETEKSLSSPRPEAGWWSIGLTQEAPMR